MTETLPFGSWPSPITPELVTRAAVSLGELHVGGDDVWWSESRPEEGGRVQIVRHLAGGDQVDVLPDGFSARTRVHEYGGGAWWLHLDTVFFCNWDDQRLYRLDAGHGHHPVPLTPPPAVRHGSRFADGCLTADGRWVVAVRELHPPPAGDGSPTEAVNELVAIDAHEGGEPVVLVTGPDFVSNPAVSPDGMRIAWLEWNHPNMPWDATALMTADIDDDGSSISVRDARMLAGGGNESLCQPEWLADGRLAFVSDRSGVWSLYAIDTATLDVGPLAGVDGEAGAPQWVFGQSRYTQLLDGRILLAYQCDGVDHLAVGPALDAVATDVGLPCTSYAALCRFGAGAVVVAGSFTEEPAVWVLDIPVPPPDDRPDNSRSPSATAIRPPRELGISSSWLSVPEHITFPTSEGAEAHMLYYPPRNPDVIAPSTDRPPLIVMIHGGPTSAARTVLQLSIQYWTSRGFAVADVNYRGSTGYGRRYREALNGKWGRADVDDCVAAASALAGRGDVDGKRLAIRGSSAGGFTTLCALMFHDVFSAGASLYGVTDLEALAKDTHKFESRYLDSLVGPYPEARDRYVERSPIQNADRLRTPLVVFQGLDDPVVPPAQAELLVAALARNGVPHAYLAFEGEQHGFRRAANIRRVLEAELYFYGQVFGFAVDPSIPPLEATGP